MQCQIDDITLIKLIGNGSFGEIFLSKKKGTNELFAVKKIKREKIDKPEYKKYLDNEIEILKELNHQNIYKFFDLKTTRHHYYLVMEYVNGGSLAECLRKFRKKYNMPFPEEIVQHLMRQIIDAFKYIHEKGIIHRDIKLENIMVNFKDDNDKNNLNLLKATVKIIDFGIAVKGSGKTTVGSLLNMAPILLNKYVNSLAGKLGKNEEEYDEKVDIWSIGVSCYEMLIGKAAFDSKTLNDLVEKIENGNYTVPTTISREMVSFLNGMIQYDSNKRLSAEELSHHPFLTKNVQDFQKIDTKIVSKKINNQGLNINIKKNMTIWSIFNEDDEKKLLNINGRGDNKVQLNRPRTMNEPTTYTSYSTGSGDIYGQIPNNPIKPNIPVYKSSKNVPYYNNIIQNAPYNKVSSKEPNIYPNNPNQNMGNKPNYPNQNKNMDNKPFYPNQYQNMGNKPNYPNQNRNIVNMTNYPNQNQNMGNMSNYPNQNQIMGNMSNYPNQNQNMGNKSNYQNQNQNMGNKSNYQNQNQNMGNMSNYPNQNMRFPQMQQEQALKYCNSLNPKKANSNKNLNQNFRGIGISGNF